MWTNAKPKKVRDQVIVITGASSGIGMATAQMAAQRGAKVVLSSYDPNGLAKVANDLFREGHDVRWIECDVSDNGQVERLAEFAVDQFGRIDTWINNAGVHAFGKIEEVSVEDARRIFEVDYWGVVHGSRAAVPHLAKTKGVLINIGSVLSSHSVPLQGHYGAAKHAVKGYTDTLRMEIEATNIPIAVCLIKPAAIDTPIPLHSKNYMREKARLPFPLYSPDVVADAILQCARHPKRDLVVGAVGKLGIIGQKYASYWADATMKMILFRMQKTKGAPREENALHSPPRHPPMKTGSGDFFVMNSSLYTWAVTRPWMALVGLVALTSMTTYSLGKWNERRWAQY